MTGRLPKRFADKVDFSGDCWIWTAYKFENGYGSYYDSGKIRSHRFSWEFFNGPIPKGMEVCHTCDVRACVNPKHLFLATHQDNMKDMVNKNRQQRLSGEKSSASKLTQEQVEEIRSTYVPYKKGFSTVDLGKKYGVNSGTIYRIIDNQTYKEAMK